MLSLLESNKSQLQMPFQPPSGYIKRTLGKRQMSFGRHEWGRITLWNALELDFVKLITTMLTHQDLSQRVRAREDWSGRIAEAIWKCEGDKQFMYGEGRYNGPKIKERNYNSISLYDVTWIILNHRNQIVEWTDAKRMRAEAVAKPIKLAAEPTPLPETVEKAVVVQDNGDIDDWEDAYEEDA